MVTAFDDARGLGTVLDDGGHELSFHCTAIADGSRHIEVGTRVTFLRAPGHLGRIEARGLVTLPGGTVVDGGGPTPAALDVPQSPGPPVGAQRDDDTMAVFLDPPGLHGTVPQRP